MKKIFNSEDLIKLGKKYGFDLNPEFIDDNSDYFTFIMPDFNCEMKFTDMKSLESFLSFISATK